MQEKIHDKFVDRLVQLMAEQIKTGVGFGKDITQGPLINKAALDKVD